MPPIWKGSLTFGLVHIPVQLQSAVRSSDRVHFRQLHAADHSPIRLRRVCELEQEEVPWSEIVKGYEYEKGQFVVLTPDEIKAVALPSSKVIEVRDFVGSDEVDPRYFDKPYYLLPQKGGERPYALLREAIRESGMVGIGTVTLREGSHHLVAVRVVENALVLELMRYADELVPIEEYAFPEAGDVRPQELKMATQLIGNLAESFDPAQYHDEYQEALRALIARKLEGQEITATPVQEPRGTPVVDLLARLRESVALGKEGLVDREGGRTAKPAAGKGKAGAGAAARRKTARGAAAKATAKTKAKPTAATKDGGGAKGGSRKRKSA